MDKGEEQIRRAMQEGQFDDLPGKGKPFNLDENPFEDPEWRMANKILRESGFTLPWIESNREIEAALETSRAGLWRAWLRRQNAPESRTYTEVEAEWQRAASAFRGQITEINKLIWSYNLEVPLERFQRRMVDADKEIEKIRLTPLDE